MHLYMLLTISSCLEKWERFSFYFSKRMSKAIYIVKFHFPEEQSAAL